MIFLDRTNFYSEAGGQIGDIGTIKEWIKSKYKLFGRPRKVYLL